MKEIFAWYGIIWGITFLLIIIIANWYNIVKDKKKSKSRRGE